MTDEEIMELCRAECEAFRWPSSAIFIARAIEQKVREECAVICEEISRNNFDRAVREKKNNGYFIAGGWSMGAKNCAEAIRGRGKNE